jgi:opacity protein-like surface antigen
MKHHALVAVALSASATIAQADGPTEAVVEAPSAVAIAAPVAMSFAGAYGGLEYGRASSSGIASLALTGGGTSDSPRSFNDGDAFGVFGGYNFQNGRFVYGGELRYLSFNGLDGVLNTNIENVFDVRGRLGVAAGSFLFYGALGWSWVDTSSATSDGSLDGLSYGLGAEYNLTDRFMIGLDYTARDMDGTFSPNAAYDGDVDTFTLRAGLRF